MSAINRKILSDVLRKTERQGYEVVMCPKCSKTAIYSVTIDALNAWAFKDGMTVAVDGRRTGCNCFRLDTN